jgi:hypothetical protein
MGVVERRRERYNIKAKVKRETEKCRRNCHERRNEAGNEQNRFMGLLFNFGC